MTGQYHVTTYDTRCCWDILKSLDTYEAAVAYAKDALQTLAPDVAIEVTHGGLAVWGPFYINKGDQPK